MENKVIILLATFNRAHLILETLDSIKNQTYTDFKCLVTDDNSTDETKEVVTDFCKNDSRFSYHRKPSTYPEGLSANRNFGLDLAEELEAQFIQFFDDDDLMHPKKLELQVAPLLKDKTLDMTLCMYRKFDLIEIIEFNFEKANDGSCHIAFKDLFKAFFLNQANLNSLGPLWKASKILKYRFDEELYYAEEREFYLRIFLLEEIRYKPVEKVLFWYRKHEKAITSNLYCDSSIKEKSEELFAKKYLDAILSSKNAPYFLVKSYLKISIKSKRVIWIKKIRKYLSKPENLKDPKKIALLIYSYLKY
ncbi:glycosyltransferase family 2 protein [Leeuwenhoekiella aequorea]|uniref:Glycosyltransferase involved in cell wall biosynthesis n=1 Tax=Leeuwenhoekiella aequorea TaxID=283736 RepID=A0A4Q0PDH6_9FLAO|nr:glycosyltransferase family A protein [Leeuwenhoekiella aequorea]RXG24903.1 glycosyltransferase involved in cell wall biosynthesis [Leeuwenhoekiella aequorea]